MYKKVILTIGLVLLSTIVSVAGVFVNEISTCNYSSHMNKESYNFSNYIEFGTDGDSINLNGYLIVHFGKQAVKGQYVEKWRWRVDKDWMVGPYSVLWLDECTQEGHAHYKLDADGGYIKIFSDGEAVDSFYYKAMDINVAYGRGEGGETAGFMSPTPGMPNTRTYSDLTNCRCPSPQFSHIGGVMEEPFEMVIEGEGSIYYTTNGSEPSKTNGALYEGPIYIGKNTNIRAKAFSDTLMPSTTITASYFVEDEAHSATGFTLPIVSITVDSTYFYDDTIGICIIGKNGIAGEKSCTRGKANYNREWDRPINFEYIVDGQTVVNQELEAKVEGGCSRTELIKSLSLKSSKKTGKDSIDYHFFQSKPNTIHKTLHLRNGGTAYSKVRFRDGLHQTLALNMNIDYQAFQPVAYYINGVYQGLMALNERTNSDYIETNYGIEKEDIDLISLSDQLGIKASEGTYNAYDDLVSTLSKTSPKDSVLVYERALGRMDMDEYVDYQVFQQFIVNTDWPGNNTKLWRKSDGGKFRWILFDTDFGLVLPGYEYLGGASKNMIYWCAGLGSTQWANNRGWMTKIFKSLYENRFFKKKFMTKYLIHLSTTFKEERIEAVFDSITGLVDKEYQATFNGKSAIDAASSMRATALSRPKFIYGHLQKYVGGGETVDLQIATERDDAKIYFNGEPIQEYDGKYFLNYELELNVIPPKGYELDHWAITCDTIGNTPADTLDPRMSIPGYLVTKLRSGGKITATFRTADSLQPTAMPKLVINEICSSSNALSKNPDINGKYGDWIEIYNYGEKSYDLANYTLSLLDSDAKTIKRSTIPTGYEQTIIRPQEHKILWAKGDTVYGPSSLNFTIDKDSLFTICLSRNDSDIVDCVELVPLQTNESYARETDGAENWVVYTADPLELNPTPGKKNGEKDTTGVQDNLAEEESILLYPNPTENEFTILSSDNMEQIVIYDMTGRVIFREEVIGSTERTIDTSSWDKGLYIVKAITKGQIKIAELIKGGS